MKRCCVWFMGIFLICQLGSGFAEGGTGLFFNGAFKNFLDRSLAISQRYLNGDLFNQWPDGASSALERKELSFDSIKQNNNENFAPKRSRHHSERTKSFWKFSQKELVFLFVCFFLGGALRKIRKEK